MKKIGVISDTHLQRPDAYLEEIASRYFSDVDLIIHAGDMVTLDVLDVFFSLDKELIAVCGNMDHSEVKGAYPAARTVTVEQVTIGITHGWGSPHGIRRRVLTSFPYVNAVIYGHSHQAFSGMEAGVFFFNPGSPTDYRFTIKQSIGIIEVRGNTITGAIVIL
jgi:putative phosphoesterase